MVKKNHIIKVFFSHGKDAHQGKMVPYMIFKTTRITLLILLL